jgi:glycerol-3-phosphate cytidylyltransferase-like family protein
MDVVFTYGRFNPPHLGHKMMIEDIVRKARNTNKKPVVIVSHSTGTMKNPLSVANKLRIMRGWFPGVTFMSSAKNRSITNIVKNFGPNSVMVVGENRKNAFNFLRSTVANNERPFKREYIKRPNGAPSATQARAAAMNGNKELFKNLTGYNLTNNLQKKILESSKMGQKKPKYKKL